jgi:hypothetical protein
MFSVARQGRYRTIRRAPVRFELLERHVTTDGMVEEESSGAKLLERWRANKSGDCQTMQQIASYANGIAAVCKLIKVHRFLLARIFTDDEATKRVRHPTHCDVVEVPCMRSIAAVHLRI